MPWTERYNSSSIFITQYNQRCFYHLISCILEAFILLRILNDWLNTVYRNVYKSEWWNKPTLLLPSLMNFVNFMCFKCFNHSTFLTDLNQTLETILMQFLLLFNFWFLAVVFKKIVELNTQTWRLMMLNLRTAQCQVWIVCSHSQVQRSKSCSAGSRATKRKNGPKKQSTVWWKSWKNVKVQLRIWNELCRHRECHQNV